MAKLAYLITIIAAAASNQALEPHRIILTDVEQNVYIETLHITSRQITPDCPIAWSVDKYILRGGKQEGVEVIEVNNGRLSFTVVPTRGMSMQQAIMDDLRLGWDSPVKGPVHPKFVNLSERQGLGWLYGFNEWMVRCGLEFFGAPGPDEFIDNTGKKSTMDLTLHGKIGNIPASQVEVIIERQPPYRIRIRGRVEEACLHGPKLELLAETSTLPGSNTLQVSDTITNRSAIEQEFGILYHANYGPPLMEQGAKFVASVRQVTPINDISASGPARDGQAHLKSYDSYPAPTPGVAEHVFCMQLWADENNNTKVMLRNAKGDKAVSMAFSIEQLPFFTLWKNPVALEDGYVTGLEPGTGFSRNRSVERRFGRVPKLAPHQSRSFTIDFTLHTDKESINAAADEISRIQAERKTQMDKDPLPLE